MFRFTYLNKQEKEHWLPQLFDLLYENMKDIAPSGLTYEAEKAEWLANVSSALEKEPRKMLLCFADGELAGFVQFYTRAELLMVEEVQLRKTYHRSFLFYRICKFLRNSLPTEITVVEAYAEKRNLYSQKLMQKLGMEVIGEDGPFVHLHGQLEPMRKYFR